MKQALKNGANMNGTDAVKSLSTLPQNSVACCCLG